jgi:hypothetical protein
MQLLIKLSIIQEYIFLAEIKIKVKPPEVYFSIKKQYPKVGHKNKFILIYKIHLDRFIINAR